MLLQRVRNGADAMSAREALEIATNGGAAVLRRSDCGALAAGRRADIAIWDMTAVETAGAWDPVAALVLCGPFAARDVFVDGRPVVRNGALVNVGLDEIVRRANLLTRKLLA